MTRAEALAQGIKWYNVTEPCKHGHMSPRYTKNGCCVECTDISSAKRRDSLKAKELRYKSKYQLSIEEVETQIAQQDGKCAICKNEFEDITTKRACVDHCHVTGKVREVLCSSCNVMIGQACDDVTVLAAAIEYLHKHKKF